LSGIDIEAEEIFEHQVYFLRKFRVEDEEILLSRAYWILLQDTVQLGDGNPIGEAVFGLFGNEDAEDNTGRGVACQYCSSLFMTRRWITIFVIL
jgi:hypothetical protein